MTNLTVGKRAETKGNPGKLACPTFLLGREVSRSVRGQRGGGGVQGKGLEVVCVPRSNRRK